MEALMMKEEKREILQYLLRPSKIDFRVLTILVSLQLKVE